MGITVVSLFDGISCGQEAIRRAGIVINKYIAYEINSDSIAITQKIFQIRFKWGV